MDAPLDRDLPCLACGYNLRGLRPSGRCPECGMLIVATLDAEHVASRGGGLTRGAEDYALFPVAAEAASTVDGAMFVADCLRAALAIARQRTPRTRTLTAAEVCTAVRHYAQRYFNDADEARELLTEWGLASARQVVRVAEALVRHGRARVRAIESPATDADLDTAFKLEDLFEPEQ